jgi:hypothetical protein
VSDKISLSEDSSNQVRSVPIRLLFGPSNVRSDQAIEKSFMEKKRKKKVFEKEKIEKIEIVCKVEKLGKLPPYPILQIVNPNEPVQQAPQQLPENPPFPTNRTY